MINLMSNIAIRPEIKLQIYILCRDRPGYSLEAIASVLQNATSETEVIISDNSEGCETSQIAKRSFRGIRYIRRDPPLPAVIHFQKIIQEATAEYISLFHDDDIMSPGFIRTMLPIIDSDKAIGAVASNAVIIDERGMDAGGYFMRKNSHILRLTGSKQLLYYYFSFKSSRGHPPFPAYIYRRSILDSDMFDYCHGGKYLDVSLLCKILKKSAICWSPFVGISYRFHSGNDSASPSTADRLSLKRYIMNHEGLANDSQIVGDLRFSTWWLWWQSRYPFSDLFLSDGWRKDIIRRFLLNKVMNTPYMWHHSVKLLLRRAGRWVALKTGKYINPS